MPGACLDDCVGRHVLAALEPAALELSLEATQRLEQERAELARLADTKGLTSQQHQAFDMLTSGRIARAFSLDQEPAATRTL